MLPKKQSDDFLLVWKHNKAPEPNLTSVYLSLLYHLILIPLSFPPRWNPHYRMTTTLWSACFFPCGWHKLLKQSDESVNTRQFDMFIPLSKWTPVLKLSSLPIQTITWSFPWLSCLHAGTNRLCWLSRVLFPGGIFLFCSIIPLFERHADLLLNSWNPSYFCSWSWEALCCATCPGGSRGGMLWTHHQHGIISCHGGKEHSLLFLSL